MTRENWIGACAALAIIAVAAVLMSAASCSGRIVEANQKLQLACIQAGGTWTPPRSDAAQDIGMCIQPRAAAAKVEKD